MVGTLPSFILDVLTQERPGRAFNGWTDEVGLPDLVQLACLEGGERMLLIQKDGFEGQIFFSRGEIVHATSPQGQGEDAFFQLMGWSSGVFLLRKAQSPVQTINTPWNFLLIEALRRSDEDQAPRVEAKTPVTALVVDDSKVVCKALRKILQDEHGVERVINAANGKEAIEMLERHRPTIVTLA
jgi:hypothetical protein